MLDFYCLFLNISVVVSVSHVYMICYVHDFLKCSETTIKI